MSRIAQADYPIHELVAKRWSPCGFDGRPVADSDLRSILEAARWAASSYNEQPWSFIVAMSDDAGEFERMCSCLVDGNQTWARRAPVLMLAVANLTLSRNNKPNTCALHDLGLATGNMCLEATARGLCLHIMGGIHPELARELYQVPETYEILTAIALGYPAPPDTLPDELRQRDTAPRTRHPLRDFVYSGLWGATSDLVT